MENSENSVFPASGSPNLTRPAERLTRVKLGIPVFWILHEFLFSKFNGYISNLESKFNPD
jgi:hypothetical protein